MNGQRARWIKKQIREESGVTDPYYYRRFTKIAKRAWNGLSVKEREDVIEYPELLFPNLREYNNGRENQEQEAEG